MARTVVLRRDYLHYIKKYNRFEKRHHNLPAHLSPAFGRTRTGDIVTVGQCRPISKTVRFNVVRVEKQRVEGNVRKTFVMFWAWTWQMSPTFHIWHRGTPLQSGNEIQLAHFALGSSLRNMIEHKNIQNDMRKQLGCFELSCFIFYQIVTSHADMTRLRVSEDALSLPRIELSCVSACVQLSNQSI